jgi:hypothetical protein
MSDLRKDIKRPSPPPPPADRFVSQRMGSSAPSYEIMKVADDAMATVKRQGNRFAMQVIELLKGILNSQKTMSKDLELLRNRLDSIEQRLPSKSRSGY